MNQQSVFNSKLQQALDCLIDDALKPFDPYRFVTIMETKQIQQGSAEQQNKASKEIPHELKSQKTRETLYLLQSKLKQELQERFSNITSKTNIPTVLEQFEEQYYQRQCLRNLDIYQDQREFLICSQNYDEDNLINSLINEAIFDSIQQNI
ncbi:unnamed protein product [Paramecium sonneborni]|uniref:Uncharacterized protein n=1 Tax=Paramecium sonneborni TaxID=65129 RepID=A0A8S1PFD3_9CILI|nr:unnamed protein product [Paramecium sonneborni]